jgi:heterodisulfide reductase subunit C1
MGKIYDRLCRDVRFEEGLNACINCGTCTAICPAASFYNYDPRIIADIVQTRDDAKIIALLKSETIWFCGECMSCKTRCPRSNTPGLIVISLRSLSQELGYFVESEKGRQQLAIKRTVGENILKYGYCVHIDTMETGLHPEQGPIWDWFRENVEKVSERLGANYNKPGAGALRKISKEALDELKSIFEETGAFERWDKIERFSEMKAAEMGLDFGEGHDEYFMHVYKANSKQHDTKH